MNIWKEVFGFDIEEEARKALIEINYKKGLSAEIVSHVNSITMNDEPITVERAARLLCVDFDALNNVMKGELEKVTKEYMFHIRLSFFHLANRQFNQRKLQYYQQLNKLGVQQ